MHEQMTNQCVNQLGAQVCMRVSAGVGRNESFAALRARLQFGSYRNLVPASSVGYRLGRVVKERLIALWETKGSTIMCS